LSIPFFCFLFAEHCEENIMKGAIKRRESANNTTPNSNKRIVIIAYSNKLPTPDDYISNFIEEYYMKEFEQRVYLHFGPVVENQREVWVLNDNSIYAKE
jgi:hypothetical protein